MGSSVVKTGLTRATPSPWLNGPRRAATRACRPPPGSPRRNRGWPRPRRSVRRPPPVARARRSTATPRGPGHAWWPGTATPPQRARRYPGAAPCRRRPSSGVPTRPGPPVGTSALDAVDKRASFKRHARTDGVYAGVGLHHTGGGGEAHDQVVTPSPLPPHVDVPRTVMSRGARRVVQDHGGALGPGRHPHGQGHLCLWGLGDGDGGDRLEGVTGAHFKGEHSIGHRLAHAHLGQMVELDPLVGVTGQVVLETGDEAHDVRRAARAPEPGLAPAAAGLERVHIEEALSVQAPTGEEPVVKRPLGQVGVTRVPRGQGEPPAQHDAGDGSARLAVRTVRRQLEGLTESFVLVPAAHAPGDVGLGRDGVLPLVETGRQEVLLTGLHERVSRAAQQVERPDGVPAHTAGFGQGNVVLEVLGRTTSSAGACGPAAAASSRPGRDGWPSRSGGTARPGRSRSRGDRGRT